MTTVPGKEAVRDIAEQAKPPFLRRVRIRGYKSIAFCDVTLEPLTILVGRNASGKSNFLDALAFLRDLMEMRATEAVSSPRRSVGMASDRATRGCRIGPRRRVPRRSLAADRRGPGPGSHPIRRVRQSTGARATTRALPCWVTQGARQRLIPLRTRNCWNVGSELTCGRSCVNK